MDVIHSRNRGIERMVRRLKYASMELSIWRQEIAAFSQIVKFIQSNFLSSDCGTHWLFALFSHCIFEQLHRVIWHMKYEKWEKGDSREQQQRKNE